MADIRSLTWLRLLNQFDFDKRQVRLLDTIRMIMSDKSPTQL